MRDKARAKYLLRLILYIRDPIPPAMAKQKELKKEKVLLKLLTANADNLKQLWYEIALFKTNYMRGFTNTVGNSHLNSATPFLLDKFFWSVSEQTLPLHKSISSVLIGSISVK